MQWLAFSAPGNVAATGIVYCNYGRLEDFALLTHLDISLKGRVALIRYGGPYRGEKVVNAEKFGASAVLIYSDPADCASRQTESVYPFSEWMPPGGVQRGTVINSPYKGDPLSPGQPAKANLYRSRTIDEVRADGLLPHIPALPIGYGDAAELLRRMTGPQAPAEWQGGIAGITYKLGPDLLPVIVGGKTSKLSVTVSVAAKLEQRTIRNVVGYIHGREDPDQYVLLGESGVIKVLKK